MRVNLNQLRCFYFAAKFGSITKAAEALFVTPSAVTMQIKKLEQWLDVRLLVREGNAIRMTREARTIHAQAEKIFREVETLELHLENLERARKMEVVIGSHYIPATYIMPNLMARVKRLFPKLNVTMVLDSIPRLVERLNNNDIHFALTASIMPSAQVSTIPLFTEEFPLVAVKGSKHVSRTQISIREIASIPLLLPDRRKFIVDDYLEPAGVQPNIAMDNLDADVIKQLIIQDLGVSFILRFAVENELESGQFQEIGVREGLPNATFSLAYLRDNYFSSEVLSLVGELEKEPFERADFV